MAIAIKSITSATEPGASATVSATSSESPSATAVGDLVIVLHSNDFYTLATMPTPTATGSPTMNSIGSVDGGSSEGHTKAWWYVANTAGAQTVSAVETGTHDEEKAMTVIVLSGADTTSPIDGTPASTFSVTGSTSHTIPSISPTTSTAFQIAIDATGGGNAATSYSASGWTAQKYFSVSTFFSGEVLTRQLSASGATGTSTITTVGGGNTFVLTFAVKVSSGGGAQTVSPSGIASAEAFGSSAKITSGVAPSGVATGETFGTAVITTGPVSVAPTGIATVEAFGTAAKLTSVAAPTGIGTAEAFGTATVAPGAVTVAPSGVGTAETFGTHVVTPGGVTVAPSGVTSAEAFGTAAVSAGGATVTPTGIASAESFGAATLTAGPVTVTPTGIPTGEAFGQAVASAGGTVLSPTGVPTAETFGTAAVTPGGVTIAPTGAASAETFGAATVTPPPVSVAPAGIASAATLGVPGITAVVTIGPAGITSGEQAGAPLVTIASTIAPAGIASSQAFGTTVVVGGSSVARDLTLTFTPAPDRWTFTPAAARWSFTAAPARWSFTEEPMDEINLAEGAKGYVGGTYTETTGKDITAATVQLAIGTFKHSGGNWRAPDVVTAGATSSQKIVKLLIGDTYTPADPGSDPYLWGKVTDSPEVLPERLCKVPIRFA